MREKAFNYRFQRSTPATYGQEIARAKNVVESTFNSKNKPLIEYILSVTNLKIRGDDYFAANIKELSDRAMTKGFSVEKIRGINLYINCLGLNSAKQFIQKAQNSLEVNQNAT